MEGDGLNTVLAEPGLNGYTSRLPELSMVILNLGSEDLLFLQDVNVRQALMLSLNRPWMISQVLNGQAMLANGPIFPNSWAYYENVESYDYDPTRAIEILRDAGYVIPAEGGETRIKDGILLSFDLVHLNDAEDTQLAEMIQGYWAAIGVQVDLVAVDAASLMNDHLEPRSYDAALVDLSLMRTPDPDPYPFWHQSQTTNGQNYSMWNDRRASEYLEKARVTPIRSDRTRLYRNFQVHFSRELPALPLFFPVYTFVVSEAVGGISLGAVYDPSDRFANVTEWYLVTELEVQELETPTTEGP